MKTYTITEQELLAMKSPPRNDLGPITRFVYGQEIAIKTRNDFIDELIAKLKGAGDEGTN